MADLYPLLGFVFLGLFSPGPNVILLTASGARFGFQRTLPHVLGVALGVGIIAGVTALGVGALLKAAPTLTLGLKIIACAWILRMAWQLWHADPVQQRAARDRPFTFIQAVLFQWVNPKAWSMGIYAITQYATDPGGTRSLWAVVVVAIVFGLVNFPSVTVWAVLGQQMRRFLTSPLRLRAFNVTMALLLVATLLPLLVPDAFGVPVKA